MCNVYGLAMILEVNALERRRVECKGERVKVCEGKAGEVEKKASVRL